MRPRIEHERKLLKKEEFAMLFDVVDKCRRCGSEELLTRLMTDVGGMIRAECCMGIYIGNSTRKRVHEVNMLNSGYPEASAQSYLEQARKMGVSSILKGPAQFAFKRMSPEGKSASDRIDGDAGQKKRPVERGFACSVRDDVTDGGSVYLFACADEKHSARAEAILGHAIPHIHTAWSALMDKNNKTTNGSLTVQQKKILEGLRDGQNDTDIGNSMGISEHTVRFHVKNILKKLNARNRSHALVIAFRTSQLKL